MMSVDNFIREASKSLGKDAEKFLPFISKPRYAITVIFTSFTISYEVNSINFISDDSDFTDAIKIQIMVDSNLLKLDDEVRATFMSLGFDCGGINPIKTLTFFGEGTEISVCLFFSIRSDTLEMPLSECEIENKLAIIHKLFTHKNNYDKNLSWWIANWSSPRIDSAALSLISIITECYSDPLFLEDIESTENTLTIKLSHRNQSNKRSIFSVEGSKKINIKICGPDGICSKPGDYKMNSNLKMMTHKRSFKFL